MHIVRNFLLLLSKVHISRAPGGPVEYCTVAANISGYSVWNMLRITLLPNGILRWRLDFWKICSSLIIIIIIINQCYNCYLTLGVVSYLLFLHRAQERVSCAGEWEKEKKPSSVEKFVLHGCILGSVATFWV
jgi:hypothetical protein